MSKFTEGPWQVQDRTVYALQHHGWRKGIEQFENRFSANVQGAKCPDDELSANAVLMAAAPELLEQLTRLFGMCVRQLDFNDDGDGLTFERVRAVIAKATGGAA